MQDLDAGVFSRASRGDMEAITQLIRRYGPEVRKRLVINPRWQSYLDVEDVMQVTYLEAFLRIGQLGTITPEGFYSWLLRIAENNLRDAIREMDRDKRPDPRMRLQASPAGSDSVIGLYEALSFTTTTASRYLSVQETHQLLEAAITKLPEVYQKVVRCCDLAGQSAQEAATALGRSVGAVKMLRLRAHDRLRELLGGNTDALAGLTRY